ncbi:LysR family transcriptional regulator [Pseudomonas japonica]|uniref:DNA-binding transcriptional regulator, LysR family n=1 Tax=Pseudomonas japonica TaxID=256466 RepID=A0A239JKD2_9PSED|nr:LysR family transcriptional regulator [Pseudomonas japonica]SNT06307.1 DNA-binding transcriptional regulator, LysR family [Pseudomonas japonica]
MDRFQEMKVLLAVTDAGSFAAGARLLGMSPPSVTRVIAGLEQRLGTLLLARSTRSLRLTEAGRRFVADCKRILVDLQEAEELATGSDIRPRGNLTVTAPVMFGELFLVPLITEFLMSHPEVTVNALLVDRLVNMVDEGVDVAVRIGLLADTTLQAIQVGEIRPVVCAAPAFLDQVGRPATPDEVLHAPIVMSSTSNLLTEWQFDVGGEALVLRPEPRLLVSSNQAAINAACQGWGFTRVLSYQAAERVARGELELVLEDYAIQAFPVHVLYQPGARVPAKVSRFVEHCVERFRDTSALHLSRHVRS